MTTLPVPLTVPNGPAGLALVGEVLGAVDRWVAITQGGRTDRARIAAWETVTTTEIHAKRDVLLAYLTRTFDEREQNFRELFQILDIAINTAPSAVADILAAITTLATASPLAEIGNLDHVRTALADPRHQWDV